MIVYVLIKTAPILASLLIQKERHERTSNIYFSSKLIKAYVLLLA